jgi:hypothetical protein
MKNAILAGAIAGAVSAPGLVVSAYVFGNMGVFVPPGGTEIWTPSMLMLLVIAHLSLGIIWGAIFGLLFASLYGWIPGKGVVKGVYYGLLIWMIKDVAAGSYLALTIMEVNAAIMLIIGFFWCIVYGPVLGYLYKK